LERIEVLHVHDFVSNYITTHGFPNLGPSRISDSRIIGSANLRTVYLSIRVDVTPGVPLMCEKSPVAYTAIEEGQTVITSLVVWGNIRARSE